VRVLGEYNFFSRSVETVLFAEIPDGKERNGQEERSRLSEDAQHARSKALEQICHFSPAHSI
jgi:hypothetical protein